MIDNGTQYGINAEKGFGFNKGFMGNKSDKEEGGHRVPFYIRWPKAGISGEVELDFLSAHIDLIPTLAALCELEVKDNSYLDGVDLSKSILERNNRLEERVVFIHHRQDWRAPDPEIGTCIMQDEWRLINGSRLYDIKNDQKQTVNLIEQHANLAEELLLKNREFIELTRQYEAYQNLPVAQVGSPHQDEIKLTIQHAIGEDRGIWMSKHVASGIKNSNSQYAIEIMTAGKYTISCRRWPKECPGPILGVPSENPKNQFEYQTINPEKVRIEIFDQIYEQEIDPDQEAVEFQIQLLPGKTMLKTEFEQGDENYGVYYTYIRKLR